MACRAPKPWNSCAVPASSCTRAISIGGKGGKDGSEILSGLRGIAPLVAIRRPILLE